MKVRFITPLSVTELPNNTWRLDKEFVADIHYKSISYELNIKAGFVTDFCSVPRIPFVYELVGGIGNKAGLVHDALYSNWSGVSIARANSDIVLVYDRLFADTVLSAGLAACGVGLIKRNAMYGAVRMFGDKFYKKGK